MISVVIPLYNKEKAIVRTLESVFHQTVASEEIIVVNDGSTDKSLQVVENFIRCNVYGVKIKIISQANAGVSAARNKGIKEAKGEYVALLDGDDLWEPTFLEEQVKLIYDFPKAGMWGVNTAFIKGGKTYKWEQGMGEGYRGYVENYFGTKHNDLYCSSSVVIRKEVFENVGYFDERISSSEDLDMWYRIILKYPVVFYDKVLVYYNQDAENRVAYDTDTRFPLTKDIKYYFDKFNDEFDHNPVFSRFMNNYMAANLLKEGYYFGTAQERKDSDVVVKKLRYQDIHPKYRWIFKTPRWFGYIIYQIVCLKKKIK
jgi:glycosyltransferase involved in cell wall biosynthesis